MRGRDGVGVLLYVRALGARAAMPLAPHHVSADADGELRVRILFAAEPDKEGEVWHLIEQALSGQLEFPDGFATPWQLRTSWPSEISTDETSHAQRLIRSVPVAPGGAWRSPRRMRWC